jgi:hypothetical protein
VVPIADGGGALPADHVQLTEAPPLAMETDPS